MGTRASIGKQPGAFTIIGDDPKKYAAAMVEYTKEKVRWRQHGIGFVYTSFDSAEVS